jgi:hypothetical protein
MIEIKFTIPTPAVFELLVAKIDGFEQHRIFRWGVTSDRELIAVTAGGDYPMGYTSAILHPNGYVGGLAGGYSSPEEWLSAVRERWEAADAETTAALLAAREERG